MYISSVHTGGCGDSPSRANYTSISLSLSIYIYINITVRVLRRLGTWELGSFVFTDTAQEHTQTHILAAQALSKTRKNTCSCCTGALKNTQKHLLLLHKHCQEHTKTRVPAAQALSRTRKSKCSCCTRTVKNTQTHMLLLLRHCVSRVAFEETLHIICSKKLFK